MKFGFNVKGLTTAASIWVIAAVGLAIGAGMYWATAIATSILLFALIILEFVERWIFPSKFIKHLQVYSTTGFELKTAPILNLLKKNKISVRTIDIEQTFDEKRTSLYFVIQINEKVKINALAEEIGAIQGVQKVKLRQIV